MKVFHNDIHVKTIPKKFKDIPFLPERFQEAKYKRLSVDERLKLEVDLFKMNLEKYSAELIKDLDMKKVEEVHVNDGTSYYVGVFGRLKVKIPYSIFRLCTNQGVSYRTL